MHCNVGKYVDFAKESVHVREHIWLPWRHLVVPGQCLDVFFIWAVITWQITLHTSHRKLHTANFILHTTRCTTSNNKNVTFFPKNFSKESPQVCTKKNSTTKLNEKICPTKLTVQIYSCAHWTLGWKRHNSYHIAIIFMWHRKFQLFFYCREWKFCTELQPICLIYSRSYLIEKDSAIGNLY